MKTITISRTGWIPEGESERNTLGVNRDYDGVFREISDRLMFPSKKEARGWGEWDVRKVRVKATLTLERELI